MPFRVQVEWVDTGLSGGPHLSTFISKGDTTSIGAFAAAVRTAIDSSKALYSNDVTATVVPEADVFDAATGVITARVAVAPGAPVVGTSAGDNLPTATQGLLRLSTGVFVGGRELRGKLFLPRPTEDLSTNGVPTAAYLTGNAAFNTLAAGPTEWSVWSRKNGVVAPVASCSIWSQWAVLRSRRG